MKAVFFKYHADISKKDLRDSADNKCGLIDPDFRSNKVPVWSVCGPYVRKNLEKGDVVFFLPTKGALKRARIWNSSYPITGVLVVKKLLNPSKLGEDNNISNSYKNKYGASLLGHLKFDVPRTRMIRTGKIVIGDKEKSMWLYPNKRIFTNEIDHILNSRFNKDFTKRRVPYITGRAQVKKLYKVITGRKLD